MWHLKTNLMLFQPQTGAHLVNRWEPTLGSISKGLKRLRFPSFAKFHLEQTDPVKMAQAFQQSAISSNQTKFHFSKKGLIKSAEFVS